MRTIKIILILIIIPAFTFSQQRDLYYSEYTTNFDNNGNLEASIKGNIGVAPNFENLNKLLGEFSKRINIELSKSNYVVVYSSALSARLMVDNEIEIKLKLFKSTDGRKFVISKIRGHFITDNMFMNDPNWGWSSYSRESAKTISSGDEFTGWSGIFKNYHGEEIEVGPLKNLNQKNPEIDYSLVLSSFFLFQEANNMKFQNEDFPRLKRIEQTENLVKLNGMLDILPNINEKKYLIDQAKIKENNDWIAKENEKIRKKSSTSSQNNSQSNSNESSNSSSEKKPNVYDAILKDFNSSDKNYLERIKTMDSDPQHIAGNKCGYGYSNCKYCGKNYRYEKTYNSNIHDIKFMFSDLGKVAIDGQLMFTVALTPNAFAGIIKNYSKELKTTINQIRSGSIYYCAGKPSGFCSRKCQVEFR